MKGFYKCFAQWVLMIPASLFMAIFGRLIAPVLPFFADETARLPNWLNWFNTPHTNLDGDRRHRERWKGDSAFDVWKRRTAWLLRNVAYGFDRDVLGKVYERGDGFAELGTPHVGDLSGVSGLNKRYITKNGRIKAFQFYYVKHYRVFGVWKCVRAGIGWKIWSEPEYGRICQFWLYAHPFKSSGKNV